MINKLSVRLTERLLAKDTITEEEQELYVYGFFMLLSHLMYFLLACVFGLILGCFIESVVFYISFQFIRRYAGGYHAASETRCEILSVLSIIGCIVLMKSAKAYDFQTVFLILSAVSAVLIFSFCPLDTPEKPLSEKEFKYFRKISWLILLIIVVFIVISYIFNWNIIFTPCCISLILESVLITAGKIKKVSVNRKKKSNT